MKIKSEVTQVGKTMAMIRGTMMSMDEKVIYTTCDHHKVRVPSKKEHLVPMEAWEEGKAKL